MGLLHSENKSHVPLIVKKKKKIFFQTCYNGTIKLEKIEIVMAYSDKGSKETQAPQEEPLQESQPEVENPGFGIPNSAMSEFFGGAGNENPKPNTTVFREMFPFYHQIPEAEAEADRLSAGIQGSGAEEVRREMGSRLNADLSGVRFHSDNTSRALAAQMGARAWTSGRDVYFGKGGFEPVIAAHELVHTVQQGAVRGNVSQHAPAGTVQMWSLSKLWPWSKKHEDVDTRTYDTVDFLVKMEAGNTSNRGEISAKKGIKYAEAYQRTLNDTDSEKDADNAGIAASKRTKIKKTRLLKNDEKTEFRNRIESMTYEDFDEVMSRWEDEAVALYDYRESLGENGKPGELDFKAVNSPAGRNYKIFKSIIGHMEKHIDRQVMNEWKARRAQTAKNDPERINKIIDAQFIYIKGTDIRQNAFMKTAEGIKSMKAAGKEADKYYKKVYQGKAGPKKKTAIDKLAAIYKERKEEERQAEEEEDGQINQPLIGAENNNIDNDSDDNIIRTNTNQSGMKESNQDKLADKFNEEVNLIDKEIKPERKPNPNAIIRQRGIIDEKLVSEFSSGNKNIANVKEANSHFGIYKSAANDAAQISNLSQNTVLENSFGAGASTLGMVSGALGVAAGIHDIKRNYQNVAVGGEKMEVFNSALDTATSAASFVSGGLGTLNNLAKIPAFTEAMSSVSQLGGANLVPGLNIATGAGTAISGGIQAVRGQKSINNIDKQILALRVLGLKNRTNNPLTDGQLTKNQQKLMNAFNQGRRKSEMNRATGAMKALSGALTVGSGIASLSGPIGPAVALGLGIASLGVSGIKYIYEKIKKRNMRVDITAEDMGINWDQEMRKVRRMFPNQDLSNKEVRAIILKGHGYTEGTRTAALKAISMKRAKLLIDTAEGEGPEAPMALEVIAALGVHPRNNGRFTTGAVKLLADKLS